ncbi:citrate:proton symporter [Metabacillus sp. KIGAM252]|uniref:Citrate:proton symporter n=1 Tax=Metabacillus flavus TaxID=2823519 RepID=A0ABS5LBP0_9BACI|nr:citrate:proton symporter [Metabacillus flavus]MBS2968141.1 citrate:proton symporter [Metabacillus flavus]
MLALLGFSMIAVFMFFLMTGRLSALIALIIVPILFAVIGGFAGDLGPMIMDGIQSVAPTGVMLLFAILYFGIMIDSGLFDPLIKRILKAVKGDPLKVALGTALLISLVALDGDGTTSYMITISAMLPLYKRLKMNPLVLTCIAMLGFGVMNISPWGGPTARAIAALQLDATEMFTPLIPVMAGGILWVFVTAFILGRKERQRLGVIDLDSAKETAGFSETAAAVEADEWKRPKLLWFNLGLTLLLLFCLIKGILPLPILFMIAFAIAIMVNYPNQEHQKDRIRTHAGNVLAVVALVFASGVFTGILSGTKMVDAMANSMIAVIPEAFGPYFAVITAVASMPFTYFMANDPYYYGVLPIIAKTAAAYGVDPIQIARASVLGMPVHAMSPLMASAYLLCGMSGVEFGAHQKFILKWAILTSLAMIATALLTGAISF